MIAGIEEMRWSVDSISDQSGKTVLITGANSGIGLEAARILAAHGAEVVLACRNKENGTRAVKSISAEHPEAAVSAMVLDLADLQSVKKFANAFKRKYETLDLLINNAGVMAPPKGETKDGFETQFGTNHLGHFALTGLLLDLLEETPGSRIITVSSLAHRFGRIAFRDLQSEKRYSPWQAYGQSKLANLMFAIELQRRLDECGSGTLSLAVHPGFSATNLQRYVPAGELLTPVLSQSAEAGAWPTVYAATQESLKGGEYFGPGRLLETRGLPKRARISRAARSRRVAKRLWDISEELTGVSYL
jgi:NAD(P)-dependent dehydrogenase (short-subunit alcohol dehydrogenase family)